VAIAETSDDVEMKDINDQPEVGTRLDNGSTDIPEAVPKFTLPNCVDDTTQPPRTARNRLFDNLRLESSLRVADRRDNGVALDPQPQHKQP
jgi:hypothetical protein